MFSVIFKLSVICGFYRKILETAEAVARWCSVKKLLLKISLNSRENTLVEFLF